MPRKKDFEEKYTPDDFLTKFSDFFETHGMTLFQDVSSCRILKY